MSIDKNKIKELIYGRIPTEDLKEIAFQKKNELFNNIITFSPKVFIPLTTLCRDHCSYCTFVKSPSDGGLYLTEPEVLSIAQAGESKYCTEALFTLGDKPELKWDEAKDFLSMQGCVSTDEYLLNMMKSVVNNTSLFPHANPGLMTKVEMNSYKEHSVSGGIMIETFSKRLMNKGMPHFKCTTKSPHLRIDTISAANSIKYPITTGLLIGIGQNENEIVDDLFNLANLTRRYACIQEVIIQNFVSKVNTIMSKAPEPKFDFFIRVIAVSRIILPNHVSLQAPPNLSEDIAKLLNSGINDLGGISPVTIDLVNPDRLWPELKSLRRLVQTSNQVLMSRLPIYPNFISKEWMSLNMYERSQNVIDEHGYTNFTTMKSI